MVELFFVSCLLTIFASFRRGHTIVTFSYDQTRYLWPRDARRASLRAREDSDAETSSAAGFLLRGGTHNSGFPLVLITSEIDPNKLRETGSLHPGERRAARLIYKTDGGLRYRLYDFCSVGR